MDYEIITDPVCEFYFRQVYAIAEQSPDRSTQNAAILVNPAHGIICGESNHLPYGIADTDDKWIKPDKYFFVEHAERNVIYSAAKAGFSTKNLVMYCPWYACADCARAIIQSGIRRVVGHKEYIDFISDHGSWHESVSHGINMMNEAGVKCQIWSGNVFNGKKKILVNETYFYP